MHDLRALFSVALLALLGVRKVVAQECDEVVDAVVRTKPDCGAVVVDKSGEHSESTTVQEGVDALSVDEAGVQSLFIYPGVYFEQVYLPPRAANLSVYGYTEDATSYHGNTVNITYNLAQINVSGNDATATLRAWTTNLKVYNLNILNTFGHIDSKGQNLAVSANYGNQGYYGVGLYGYQDTLLANQGAQVYAKSKILGAIDFIFGQRANAWLEQIDIVTIAEGYITASGRNDTENTSWYVISNSTVSGVNATVEAKEGSTFLGRPWGEYARVVFQYTYLSQVVNPEGWSVWNPPPMERTCCVTFAEFENTGPGSEGMRADFSQQLDAAIEPEEVLGAGYADEWWVGTSYLS